MKDSGVGFGADASILNFSGSLDITVQGWTTKVGGELYIGGATAGASVGLNNSIKFGWGMGAGAFIQFEGEKHR